MFVVRWCMTHKLGIGVLVAVGCFSGLACRSGGAGSGGAGTTAVAMLQDHQGQSFGRVLFTERDPGIVQIEMMIDAKSSTTATEGDHAIHVHEGTSCDAPGFTSAGSHWNPTNEKHGDPDHSGHHAGDLGNIEIDGDRTGKKKLTSSEMTLVPGQAQTVVGRAVIVHVKEDDFTTQQPPGNAGGRIACGVIMSEVSTQPVAQN